MRLLPKLGEFCLDKAIHDPENCPNCGEHAIFSKKRLKFYCAECDFAFAPPARVVEPQTIFLSYAHKSERDEDFDVSEELVLLIKAELDRDGHTVWIDKEGIRAGNEWRERITDAILGHAHFLSFLSRRSVRDPAVCLNEIATALGSTRHLQTVLVQAEQEVAAPLTISHLQWHDFQDWREIRAGSKTGRNGESWDAWFAQRMGLLRDAVSNVQNTRVSGELQRLRDILVPSGFEARIVEKTQGFYGRQWLFGATQTWLDDSSSRMFWLKGSPGIGKSAFAAKLAHQARSAVIGFFMCDFQGRKDPEESAREAICTLAFQMASRLPDYRLKLLYQQQVDKEKVQKKSADDLFEYLITEPLNKSGKIPEATRLCLVIDGLDEAGRRDGGNALAELLAKHAERLPQWLGIIVTSRPEPYLEQILKPLSGISVDGQTEQNRQDLAAWIGERLPSELEGEERQRVIDAVIDKSGGTFLYLSLVEKDKTLDISKPETLPDKLDGIFKQNFNRYFPDAGEYGNKTEPFLRLIAAAPGPLPAQMGRQILGWSQRDLTLKVIEPLGSLLQERDGGLVFFHASLSDWLRDPKRSGTHCVEDSGAQELGEFIWSQFEVFESTEWKQQVVEWLARLTPSTHQWNERAMLIAGLEFLGWGKGVRYLDAETLAKRNLDLTCEEYGRGSAEAAQAVTYLAHFLNVKGNYDGAILLNREALTIREKVLGPEHHETARALNNLATVLYEKKDFVGAEELFRRALVIQERVHGQDHQDTSMLLNNLACTLNSTGDQAGAEPLHRRALAIREKVFGVEAAATAQSLGNLAAVLYNKGDFDGAAPLVRRSIEIKENMLGPEHPDTAWSLHMFATLLSRKGDLSGAEPLYRRALAIREKILGTRHAETATSLQALAKLLLSKGDDHGAEPLFRQALEIYEAIFGREHSAWTKTQNNLQKLLCAREASP